MQVIRTSTQSGQRRPRLIAENITPNRSWRHAGQFAAVVLDSDTGEVFEVRFKLDELEGLYLYAKSHAKQ